MVAANMKPTISLFIEIPLFMYEPQIIARLQTQLSLTI